MGQHRTTYNIHTYKHTDGHRDYYTELQPRGGFSEKGFVVESFWIQFFTKRDVKGGDS